MKTETIPIEALTLDPANVRRHGKRNLEAIKGSLLRFGQQKAIVVDENGVVVAGNGTLEAARALGWKELQVVRTALAGADRTAFSIADNRTAELAAWDEDALAKALVSLKCDDAIDELATGFTDDEIERIVRDLKGDDDIEEDEVPDPPKDPITQPGDLWILGNHRILCADSTDGRSVETVTEGSPVDMVFTDPPWNVAIGQDSNPKHRQRDGLQNDALTSDEFAAFLARFAATVRKIVTGDLYVVLGASEWPTLDRCLRDAGFHWSGTIIWAKDSFVLGRSKYHRRYEPIWYGWKTTGKSSYRAGRDQDDVWEIPRPKRSEEHPTMKPVALPAKAIQNSCSCGGTVLDPFMGAGSTLIAAEHRERRAIGIEIEPRFCDVIVERWENLTGQKAERRNVKC